MARDTDELDVADVQESPETAEVQAVEVTPEPAETTTAGQVDGKASAEEKPAYTEEQTKELVDGFLSLVDEVISDTEGRDASTGVLSEALIGKVRAAYVALPPAGQSTARKDAKQKVEDRIGEAMEATDAPLARSLYKLKQEALVARGAGAAAPRVVTDPKTEMIESTLPLYLAVSLVQVLDGVDSSWIEEVQKRAVALQDQVETYREYLDALAVAKEGSEPTEPEGIDEAVKKAAAIARGKRRTTKSGTVSSPRVPSGDGKRRNVANHITEAFAGQPSGKFLSIAEIVNFDSEEYKGAKVSAGAVNARLFPESGNCTIAGVTPTSENGKKGARKN